MPEGVDTVNSDIAKRYIELDLPVLRPHYVSDDFRLCLRFVRKSDAFYPLNTPASEIPAFESNFHVVRNAVNFPQHYVSIAHAVHRPKSRVAQILEDLLVAHLTPLNE